MFEGYLVQTSAQSRATSEGRWGLFKAVFSWILSVSKDGDYTVYPAVCSINPHCGFFSSCLIGIFLLATCILSCPFTVPLWEESCSISSINSLSEMLDCSWVSLQSSLLKAKQMQLLQHLFLHHLLQIFKHCSNQLLALQLICSCHCCAGGQK